MIRIIRKSMQFTVVIITVLIACCLNIKSAHAETLDCTAPEVNSIRFVQSVVHPGEFIDVILDVTEEESGICFIEIGFTAVGYSPGKDDNFWGALRWPDTVNVEVYKIDSKGIETLFNDDVMYTGKYRIHIPVRTTYSAACYSCERWPRLYIMDRGGIYNSEEYRNLTGVEPFDGEWVQYTGSEKLTIQRHVLDPDTNTMISSREYTDREVPTFRVEGYEFRDNLSSEELIQNIQNLESGEQGYVEIDGDGILPKEAFDALKGKDAEIVCQSSDYKWIFNGKDIINDTKDVDLNIETSSIDSCSDLSRADIMKVQFADNGTLPGKARTAIDTDIIDTDAKANELTLYYVEGNNYTPVKANIRYENDGSDTWCSFDVSHNSTYVLATKTKIIGCNSSYTYTGKYIKPSIRIIANGKTLKAGTHYTVKYSNNKYVGTSSVAIQGKGSVKGKTTKKFSIIPKRTSLSKVTGLKRAFTAKWKKQITQTTGYQIRYSTSSSMSNAKTVTLSKNRTTSKKIKKLSPKKKYYVQVRTYKTVRGKRYYSSWSLAKSVRTK